MENKKKAEKIWFGEIPQSWETIKIFGLYSLRNTKVSDVDYPPLSVTMQGIVPQLESAAKTNDHDNRKLVVKGDFAINSRSDRRGSCGIADRDGSVSLINTVLKPKRSMNDRYYNWLFHTPLFSDEFYKWGHGIVDDLWTTNWQDMKKIVVPYPPMEEQERIADYLDLKCLEIDGLIDKLQSQIITMEEYKKSVVTEAVTKGLDDSVEMKDSGIEWIEKIPKHWKIIRVKYIAKYLGKGNGITKDQVDPEGNRPCVRYGEIYSRYNNQFDCCVSRTNEESVGSKQYFGYGDILFAGTGELIEEIGKNIVYLGSEKCLAGGDIVLLKHSEDPAFLNYVLNSQYVQGQKSSGKAKLKVVHISATDIGNLYIALPKYDEQVRIAKYLNTKCNNIDQILKAKREQLEILTNYKKSLIFECVTGKKKC